MNLQSLIKTLESAAELATDGEWHAHQHFVDAWDEYGIVSHTPVRASLDTNAQAIAIRHNTAKMVLEMLDNYKRLLAWANPPNNPPTPE